ncbi:unnamed protein product [Prorocentrum cordatum]|uniref:RNA-directed RNA polymerase n=1 Tax=Prorocentrum cordatum TaxID=2364126 RepID=A0ABN9R9R0_9DINO|nr:unnamed protein product [Polarella glacialis]
MAWARAALDRLPPECMSHLSPPTHAVECGVEVRASTAFSGMDAPVVSLGMIATALTAYTDARADRADRRAPARGLQVASVFAVENNAACQKELLHSPDGPGCLVDDVTSFVNPASLRDAQQLPAASCSERLQTILHKPMLKKAWCVRHGRLCKAARAHIHVAGHPCVHRSSYGNREGMSGAANIAFYSWTSHRRLMREPILISDNVTEFGMDELNSCLGDLYKFERMEINPVDLGWPSRRPRQFVIGLLVDLCSITQGINPPSPPSPCDSPDTTLKALFVRPCKMTQDAHLISTDDERETEKTRALARPAVAERHSNAWLASVGNKRKIDLLTKLNQADPPGSFRAALSHNERLRLHAWRPSLRAGGPGHFTADLGQEPHRTVCSSWDTTLHTLIKGQGITWVDNLNRWLTTSELFASMGPHR